MTAPFSPLPPVPDHPALELEVLDLWERERTFERLRERNRGGETFSFVDGPVTANKILAIHTAWGRTLKDVFQRYKGLRGFDQRYQNGFDCQGLWIEVGVERELGLNSKREIEEYGLAEFARRCREKVVYYANELTRASIRLGQWMDWERSYYTFSDTNIEYIWRFLKVMHERGWVFQGHRSTEWCPRCGTSISQHELSGGDVYRDKSDPSVFVRLPLRGRAGEALVVWTTTPWTLPANVAAAVHPDEEYGLRGDGEWVAVKRYPEDAFVRRVPGSELVGLTYDGPFDHLPAVAGVEHRVIPWDDVSMDEGTGIVHIAPGCGSEDFELSRVHDLAILMPVDESGRFYDEYGWLHGTSTIEAADQIVGDLGDRGRLVGASEIVHRYPHCWRCETPLIFRLTDDWFLAVDDLRPRLIEANAGVRWVPDYMGKRMEDWLRNMGDWNISRRRYYGLPLPFYPCECGHLNVVGSRRELEERALGGIDQLEELRRPWIDEVPIACESCGGEVRRIPEVGDVWLDAGIVPFSTLGWQSEQWIDEGNGTGAARGLTKAPLPDHAYWEKWFPADWVSEMREQIRLWFYSQLFMSVALTGNAPFTSVLGYEKMLDETGREMHGSWGNAIEAEDAFARMGADVMRWQFCAQPPNQNLLFGFSPAGEIKRKLLTFWNSAAFFVTYANIDGFTPRYSDLARGPDAVDHVLDQWLVARTGQLVVEATDALEAQLTGRVIAAFDRFLEDLSNWYIRRSRSRFWKGDEDALRTLWFALAQSLRVMAPLTPFLCEHLWQNLVRPVEGAPDSVHLAKWPEASPLPDVLAEMEQVRRIAALGRSVRGVRVRQPLRRVVVDGTAVREELAALVREELNVKEVEFGPVDAQELVLKPNLPVLGPRLGKQLGAFRAAVAAGDFEELDSGMYRVGADQFGPHEVLVERRGKEGWAVAGEEGITVAIDTTLDDELVREGRVHDLIHEVNSLRRTEGLELTDRIVLTLSETDADLLEHADWIKREVLAVEVRTDGDLAQPVIEKV